MSAILDEKHLDLSDQPDQGDRKVRFDEENVDDDGDVQKDRLEMARSMTEKSQQFDEKQREVRRNTSRVRREQEYARFQETIADEPAAADFAEGTGGTKVSQGQDEWDDHVYGRVRDLAYYAENKRPWEYGIVLPAFNSTQPNDPKSREADRIMIGLTKVFGSKCVMVKTAGGVLKQNAFIRITADAELLFKLAEDNKIRVKVCPWHGQGYRVYTREDHRNGRLHHPFCKHSSGPSCDCCVHTDSSGGCCDMILYPYQRQELIYGRIEQVFDDIYNKQSGEGVVWAQDRGYIIDVFPLHTLHHDEKFTDAYPSRKWVARNYCGWLSAFVTLFMPFPRSRSFIEFIREYVGEKIAMYFGFLQYYTTWLIALAVPGIMLFLSQYVSSDADNIGVILYSTYVSIWSVLMLEFWKRRQAGLSFDWDMIDFDALEKEMISVGENDAPRFGFYEENGAWVDTEKWLESTGRPKYGDAISSFLQKRRRDFSARSCSWMCICYKEKSDKVETATQCYRMFQKMCSAVVVLTMAGGVVAIMLGLLVLRLIFQEFNETVGGAFAGVLTAISIAVLDFLFDFVAVALNAWEDHRTRTEFEDAFIAKKFFFNFVNAYTSLFYIAFFKGTDTFSSNRELFGHKDVCKNSDGEETAECLTELQTQLTSIMLTRMIIGNIAQFGIPWLQYHYAVYSNMRNQRSKLRKMHPNWNEEQIEHKLQDFRSKKRDLDVCEAQFLRPAYDESEERISGTLREYTQLAIQFGYVTLFAPAFPLAPVFAILSNVLELRNDSYKVLQSCRKANYQGAEDIGTWLYVFRFMAGLAVVTNMLLIAFTSNELDNLLDNPSDAAKLAIIIIAEHLIFGLQGWIGYISPEQPRRVRVAIAEDMEIQRVEREFEQWSTRHTRGKVVEEVPADTSGSFVDKKHQYSDPDLSEEESEGQEKTDSNAGLRPSSSSAASAPAARQAVELQRSGSAESPDANA